MGWSLGACTGGKRDGGEVVQREMDVVSKSGSPLALGLAQGLEVLLEALSCQGRAEQLVLVQERSQAEELPGICSSPSSTGLGFSPSHARSFIEISDVEGLGLPTGCSQGSAGSTWVCRSREPSRRWFSLPVPAALHGSLAASPSCSCPG